MDEHIQDMSDLLVTVLFMVIMIPTLVNTVNMYIDKSTWELATPFKEKTSPIAQGEIIPYEPTYTREDILLQVVVTEPIEEFNQNIFVGNVSYAVTSDFNSKRLKTLDTVNNEINLLGINSSWILTPEVGEDPDPKYDLNGNYLSNGLKGWRFITQ